MQAETDAQAHGGKQLIGRVAPTQPVSEASCFGDSRWDLSSLIHLKNRVAAQNIIVFNRKLPDGLLLTAPRYELLCLSTKEFLYARMNGLAPYPPIMASTIILEANKLFRLISWMATLELSAYSQLVARHIESQFLNHLRGSTSGGKANRGCPSDERIANILSTVQRLWHYREKMSDSLTFVPFNGKSPYHVIGVKSRRGDENRTPIIPDEVMEPLCKAALNYVLIYAEDILQARSVAESVRAEMEASGKYSATRGVNGKPCFPNYICQRARESIAKVEPAKVPHTDKPWREPFSKLTDLFKEEDYLFTACYVICAWLTGMRLSEVTSLCEECLRRELSEDGVIELIKIKGKVFKGTPDSRGREETWVTIEPTAKSIEVLTRLTERLRDWTSGKFKELFLRGDKTGIVRVVSLGQINILLNSFATHVGVPLVEGKQWRLTTRQFRRTLARWIARRPFGEIAGMIQYKQLHIATFEGYAGRDNEFRKDLAEETLLANLDLLHDLRGDFVAGAVAGPKAGELTEMFRGIAGDRRADDERYMLMHLAKILYIGLFNLCFYDPIHAMCQQHQPLEERKAPVISHCQLDKCANSCITKHNLGPWESQLHEINRALKTPKLPHPQRVALERAAEEIEHTIRPIAGSPLN